MNQAISALDISARGYANSDILVSTDWVAEHLDDHNVRIVESNEDPLLYSAGHIPNAVEIDWTRDLNDATNRDFINREAFQELCSRNGIGNDTTVVFYGDKSNWWACYALWIFTLFGHENVRLMDGGRLKWMQEGREMTRERASFAGVPYSAHDRDDSTERAFRDEVLAHVRANGKLVDVRSPQEYSGDRLHMPDYPNEGALRGGHIPGAASVPWARAVDAETGCFLPGPALETIYLGEAGLDPAAETIAYCRIGERSSHTWFVLKHLLGFQKVRNYDGSWTEWGNSVGMPIER